MSYTPGPWIVRYDKQLGSPRSIERADQSLSVPCECLECRASDDPRTYHELVTCDSHVYGPTKQDAELMAAAPELLNELRVTVRRLELCMRHAGSTPEFAQAATEQTWELILRVEAETVTK